MSARHQSAAWAVRGLSPAARLVLVYMAWRANDSNLAFPSVQSVSEYTGLSARQVQRLLKLLRPYLVPSGETVGGRGKTTVYRVVLVADSLAASKGDNSDNQRVTSEQRNGDIRGALAPERVTSEQRKGDIRNSDIRSEGVSRTVQPEQFKRSAAALDALWRAMLGELQKRINPHPFQTWVKPLRYVGIDEATLVLGVPNDSFLHLAEKYGADFVTAARASGLPAERVRLVIQPIQ